MRVIVKLTLEETKQLLKDKRLSNICVINISDGFRGIVKSFLETNTGYNDSFVMGIGNVMGKDKLEDIWDDLDNLIPMRTNEFILEFNMPDDACCSMSYNKFLSLAKVSDEHREEVLSFLKMSDHSDDCEVIFCPLVDIKYLESFSVVKDNWDEDRKNIHNFISIEQIRVFTGDDV